MKKNKVFLFVAIFLLTQNTKCVYADDPVVLEFRRTFSHPDCSTGEVYANGKLMTLFSASPSLFVTNLPVNPIVGDKITSEKLVGTGPYDPYLGGTILGFRIHKTNVNKSIFIKPLNNSTYWDYRRPRGKARSIPDNMIILGTKVINRECYISAESKDAYYDSSQYYSDTTNIFTKIVFNGEFNKDNFIEAKEREAIVVLSDSSQFFKIKMGDITFVQNRPIKDSSTVINDDPCLTKLEHMSNNINRNGVKSYERRDDVWFCTNGQFSGANSTTAIEFTRDMRYIEILSNEICSTILGLSKNRTYLININEYGNGGTAWTRCLETDDWSKLSDKADILTQEP